MERAEQHEGHAATEEREAPEKNLADDDQLNGRAARSLLEDIFGRRLEPEETEEEREARKEKEREIEHQIGQAISSIGYNVRYRDYLQSHRKTERVVSDLNRLVRMIEERDVCGQCLQEIIDEC